MIQNQTKSVYLYKFNWFSIWLFYNLRYLRDHYREQMPSVNPDQSDKDSEPFVEVDPTGRYGRYTELLGSGAVKKVYRAFDQEEGIEVAWNQVKLRNFSDDPAMIDRLYSEVRLLRSLTNNNIISLYSFWRDEEHNTLNFITEVCTSGNLREYRKKHRQVSMKALKKWSKQILKGLNYLHSHEPCIIHRDLNCSNVFVNGNTGQVIKLLLFLFYVAFRTCLVTKKKTKKVKLSTLGLKKTKKVQLSTLGFDEQIWIINRLRLVIWGWRRSWGRTTRRIQSSGRPNSWRQSCTTSITPNSLTYTHLACVCLRW